MERIEVTYHDGDKRTFCMDHNGKITSWGAFGQAVDPADLSAGIGGEVGTWGAFRVDSRQACGGRGLRCRDCLATI